MERCTLVLPVRGTSIFLAPKLSTFPEDTKGALVNCLNGWGGKVEPEDNRDMKKTAVREFEEESTATCHEEDLELVAIVDFYKGGKIRFECHIFFLYRWEGNLRVTKAMGPPEEFEFLNPPYDRMMPADRVWLKHVIAGERRHWGCYYSEDMSMFEYFEDKGPLP